MNDDLIGYLASVLNTVAYYRDPDTDGGAILVDGVALPAELYALRAEVEWPAFVTVTAAPDWLIRYYVGAEHIGTQRPA